MHAAVNIMELRGNRMGCHQCVNAQAMYARPRCAKKRVPGGVDGRPECYCAGGCNDSLPNQPPHVSGAHPQSWLGENVIICAELQSAPFEQ